MNLLLHDVHFSRFNIQQNDTLEEPEHGEGRFEAVVANPPFSAKWWGNNNPLNETNDRFSQYGALAPTSKADFALVQHMIHQLADNGAAVIVLPHGVLFRGAEEAKIRKYIIEEQNYLDAAIGRPANLFYGTSTPRLASSVDRLRSQLSATRFRQEVLYEFLSDGLSYFDLSAIENATSKTEGAICPRI